MTTKREVVRTYLTVRGVDPVLARALASERTRKGTSLNQTVIDLLRKALGLGIARKEFDNGLGRFAGTWSEEQFQEFQRNTASFGEIDEDLWK
ncbi:MAG: hypothetical protein AAB074_09280 [Planctomycetota bacterium]